MGILILIIVVLVAGISFGFVLGFSRAMREAATKLHGTNHPIVARIVIVLGCAALVGALATAIYTWHFTRIAQRTTGTIIEMRHHTNKDSGDVSYAPTFRFQDRAGAEHTVSSSFYSSPPEFHVGDKAPVLYRDEEPQTARINSYWQVWGLPTLLGVIGSIELLVGTILLLWPKIKARFGGQTIYAQAI